MNFFLNLAFLFFCGSMLGWVGELFFRRFVSGDNNERKWVNPGFLTGPYLPLYGFGLCALYCLSLLGGIIDIGNKTVQTLLLILLMGFSLTLIEYIGGIIFVRGMKIKLWDYTQEWGNIGGLICPKFSLIWTALSALYLFSVHRYVLVALRWLSENLAFSFVIGLFFGIFIIDFVYSAQLVSKVKRLAEEYGVIVRYEELKRHFAATRARLMERSHFFLSFKSERPLTETVRQYLEKYIDKLERTAKKK